MIPLRLAHCLAAAPLASWRPGLVLLSYVVAIAASFTALDVATRLAVNTGLARRVWLVSGAVMMGIGIWAMHFVGMLAFRLNIPTSYDGRMTLASMAVAIVASGFALVVASRPDVTLKQIAVGGLWMGLAINAMHLLGMMAMRMPARLHYRPGLLAVSVLIGILASMAALFLAFRMRSEAFHHTWSRRKFFGAVVLASAVTGMHYTAMAAAQFELLPGANPAALASGMHVSEVGAAAIGFATLIGLGLTLVGSLVDLERRRSQRLFELLAEASSRMGRSLEPNLILDGFVSVLVPERAPFCFVELKEDDPKTLRVRSIARVGRSFVEPHALLQDRVRSTGGGDVVDRVIRTGRALTISDLTPHQLVDVAGDGEIRRAFARAGVRSCLAVPVHIRGEVLGAVVALACEPRRFGPPDVALFEDLAGRLAHALENARLYHEAQEAIRVRDEFLTIASHELNTPLTPLQLHLQTLKNTVAASPEGLIPAEMVVPKVEMAERQQRRLARLVSELLDISRIRLGRLQL
ncbi:MAG TPA: MHYT domain-containing protein, partial [Myxococcaceae bacterium]|nr:MHYT domain-containing protein [Myxococcaceae bacterium]